MNIPHLDEADLQGKRVLLRAGFDVPMENGVISDTSRITALVPTMKHILQAGGALVILSHQGRPKGKPVPEMSQKPLQPVLEKLLGVKVGFAEHFDAATLAQAKALQPGEALLLENLRYDAREEQDDAEFAAYLASLGDVYVNDAFTNCHRKHTSMVGIPRLLPSYMGLQLAKEVEHLSKAVENPKKPLTLIVSGAKMETKVPVIRHFLQKGDHVLLGGCIANTFIAARGFDVGESRYEKEAMEEAQQIMLESEKPGAAKVHVPRDVVVASEPNETAEKLDLPVEDVTGDMKIFDIGKVTVARFVEIIEESHTIVWNGPLGMSELNRFSHASKRIAEALAVATKRGAVTIIGGGDTLDFHERYGYPLEAYTFASTAGGAMLDFLSGEPMPALEAMAARA